MVETHGLTMDKTLFHGSLLMLDTMFGLETIEVHTTLEQTQRLTQIKTLKNSLITASMSLVNMMYQLKLTKLLV